MKHKASAAVEVRFLRNFTLALTGTVYDRYGAYTHYLRDADGTLLRDENGSMLTEPFLSVKSPSGQQNES